MICFTFKNRYYMISTELSAVIIAIIIFESREYLLRRKKRLKPQSDQAKIDRIIGVALCNTRGGDLHIDKAVESCVDGPGYYELVNFAFVEELKKLLNCKSKKPLLIVSAGVVYAVERYIFKNKTATLIPRLWFIPKAVSDFIRIYRWQSLGLQIIFWVKAISLAKGYIPLYLRKVEALVFVTTIMLSQNAPFKVATKLPMILPTMQYIEQVEPRTQRVIMSIGDGSPLFENKGQQVLETPLIEIRTKVDRFQFNGDVSKLVPISESAAQKILSPNKPGAEVSRIIDNRPESGGVQTIIKKTVTQHKYQPLSQRTKTLKDLENALPKPDFIDAEVFERRVEENCSKSKVPPFLRIDDK